MIEILRIVVLTFTGGFQLSEGPPLVTLTQYFYFGRKFAICSESFPDALAIVS